MADIVSQEKRSRMMAGIRGTDTRPELIVRKALHRAGFRYRLHVRTLAGKPDIVLPKWNAVILIHGCFWHGHNCHLFKMPSTRTEFWKDKIFRNRNRDEEVRVALIEAGWRVLIIWECALKGKTRLDFHELMDRASAWIKSADREATIAGAS